MLAGTWGRRAACAGSRRRLRSWSGSRSSSKAPLSMGGCSPWLCDASRPVRLPPPQLTCGPAEGVEVEVVHPLLQRDDPVVGDLDVLGTDLGAALGDVAHSNSGLTFDQRTPVQ